MSANLYRAKTNKEIVELIITESITGLVHVQHEDGSIGSMDEHTFHEFFTEVPVEDTSNSDMIAEGSPVWEEEE